MNLFLTALLLVGSVAIVFWIAYADECDLGLDPDPDPSVSDPDRLRAWVEAGRIIEPNNIHRWATRRIKDPTLRGNVVFILTRKE